MKTSKRESLVVRRFMEGDEAQINILFNEVFNKNRDVSVWKWRFFDNPVQFKDIRNFITVAENEGNIVGQYSAVPRFFSVNNKCLKAVQVLDNIIASGHRNLKLQVEMFKFIENESPSLEGLSFGFGFPNEIAYHVGKRFLKYNDLFKISVLFKRINYAGAVRRRNAWMPESFLNLISLLSGYFFLGQINLRMQNSRRMKITQIERFSKSFDKLWKKARRSWKIIGRRDSAYLNWRYIERPNIPYTVFSSGGDDPDGFIVLTTERREHSNVGIIVDFLYTNERVFDSLICRAMKYFISEKVDYMICWALKGGKDYKTLCRNGFIIDRFDPIKMVYKVFDPAIDQSLLKDPGNWLVTYGDSH